MGQFESAQTHLGFGEVLAGVRLYTLKIGKHSAAILKNVRHGGGGRPAIDRVHLMKCSVVMWRTRETPKEGHSRKDDISMDGPP
jgi:hypothetical protein